MQKIESKKIVRIDFEISSLCNANCAICPRYHSHTGELTPFIQTYWSIDDVKKIINVDIIRNLKHLYMCGNFGDPMANPDVGKICAYFKNLNPNLRIEISTNGGIGKVETYEKLAKLGVKIRFAVDGYRENNELYRVNVKWKNLIRNIDRFAKYSKTENFGIQYLMWNETINDIFKIIDILKKHNKGILYLRKPYDKGEKSEVFDKKGCVTHFLTQIKDKRLHKYYETFWQIESIDYLYDELKKIYPFQTKPIIYGNGKSKPKIFQKNEGEYQTKTIEFTEQEKNKISAVEYQTCESINFHNPKNLDKQEYSVYITHNKLLFPCCYIPPEVLVLMNNHNGRERMSQFEMLNSIQEIGFEKFDLSNKTLREVFDSGVLHEFAYNKIYENNPFYYCKQMCGKCA